MNSPLVVLNSGLDASVNIIEKQEVGYLEARYVRRTDEYFNCYLSSQTGCNRGCGFCHLTTTKQTMNEDSTLTDYLNQAERVFEEYRKSNNPAKYVYYSFMARGEPLSSALTKPGFADNLFFELHQISKKHGLLSKFNISTIMPFTLKVPLEEIFQVTYPTIYYSVYSMNPIFRKKWMPGAMGPYVAFDMLANYQKATKKVIKIHYAFINGENDSHTDVQEIINEIKYKKLNIEWNVVRYNPFSIAQGVETSPDNLDRIVGQISLAFPNTRVRVINRVGSDVAASCGQFITDYRIAS